MAKRSLAWLLRGSREDFGLPQRIAKLKAQGHSIRDTRKRITDEEKERKGER